MGVIFIQKGQKKKKKEKTHTSQLCKAKLDRDRQKEMWTEKWTGQLEK